MIVCKNVFLIRTVWSVGINIVFAEDENKARRIIAVDLLNTRTTDMHEEISTYVLEKWNIDSLGDFIEIIAKAQFNLYEPSDAWADIVTDLAENILLKIENPINIL